VIQKRADRVDRKKQIMDIEAGIRINVRMKIRMRDG
jgi:hypothetical protein